MVEPTGYTALDLIGFTDKGPYDPTANYVRNDLVHVGNSTWRCKIDDTTGITPTEGANWTIFIESATSLAGMSDVNLNTPKAGDGLVHDGNDWKNIPIMTKKQWQNNGAYNIAPNDITSQVLNGVTVVKNANNTVTLNNTVVSPGFTLYAFNKIQIPDGTYKLVGCPSGASDNFRMTLLCNNNNTSKGNDTGSGLIFTYNASTDINLSLYLWVKTGYTCDNVVFKPMITTDLNATYDDYVPYAMTNRELTESVNELKGYGREYIGDLCFSIYGNRIVSAFTRNGWIRGNTLVGVQIPIQYRPSSDIYIPYYYASLDYSVQKLAYFHIETNGVIGDDTSGTLASGYAMINASWIKL